MIFEIADIEHGERPNDLVVTVRYWYGDTKTGAPDFVEEQLHSNVPKPVKRPKTNALGMWVLKNKSVISPFVEVDGQWVERDPSTVADLVFTELDVDALILDTVRIEAQTRVAKGKPRGEDRFDPEHNPRQRFKNPKPPRGKALKGKWEKV